MTSPTVAAREKAREIAHRGTRCQGGEPLKQARGFHDHLWQCDAMTNEIQTALIAAEQRDREMEEAKRLLKNAETDTWFMFGLVQLLREHNINFTSSDVIAAAGRVETRLKAQPAPEKNITAAPHKGADDGK